MDETEVQIEIACWAQGHPEASAINWKNGNEPWVSFSGKRCTLHLGLGGLTWSIEVPSGYQTAVDPGDGKRKRLWEPLDYLDTVIVQSSSTPFHVSVVDHANNILDLSTGLELEFADKASLLVGEKGSRDAAKQQNEDYMLKSLQVKPEEPENIVGLGSMDPKAISSISVLKEGKNSLMVGNACIAALKAAETLAEVLDAIHGLAKLYNMHLWPTGANRDCSHPHAEGNSMDVNEDEYDHLFSTELAIKWSCIAGQVNDARAACGTAVIAHARRRPMFYKESEADGTPTLSNEKSHGLKAFSSSSGSRGATEVTSHILKFKDLTVASPPRSLPVPSDSADSDSEDYTFVFQGPSSDTPDICGDSKLRVKQVDASALNVLQIGMFSDSEGDNSDSSWELASLPDHDEISTSVETSNTNSGNRGYSILEGAPVLSRSSSTSKHKRKFQQVYTALIAAQSQTAEGPSLSSLSLAGELTTKKASAEYWEGSEACLLHTRAEIESESSWNFKGLQWCDIVFNPASFSVECTIHLSEFMHNPAAATAAGFTLEHPLRVEIVPNKAHVDCLEWAGAVEVYVSQHSDWHNHISEEICGMLCLVPNIVQTYFHNEVPALIRNRARLGRPESKGDLFVGVLQMLVKRLENIDIGGFCCVCGRPGEPPSLLYLKGLILWPCGDNLCQATYATWQEVSAADSQERERDEKSSLRAMEVSLRDDFPYDDDHQHALRSALDVYSVITDRMSYGQMIRALARIELWNRKDPDTPASAALFDFDN